MSLSKIRCNCAGCEKIINFKSFGDYPDCNLTEGEQPEAIAALSLDGSVVICGTCGVKSVFKFDAVTNSCYIREAI